MDKLAIEGKAMNNSAKELELHKGNFNLSANMQDSNLLLEDTSNNIRRLRDMLGMEQYTTIKTLREKGYSKSKIAKMLGCNRKTIRKILKRLESGEAIVIKKEAQPKILDCYKDYIIVKVEEELSAMRIFQDLVSEKGYEGSYKTVANYVKELKDVVKVYVRLHSLPGAEAQVDFGYAGYVVWIDGKLRRLWVFCMSLSYSRYSYYEAVLTQDARTFLQCHINAFRFFGGVADTVKIDNLKSAILEANFYEPEYQFEYSRFALHYGFKAIPCRVATPTDKGKVESNIKYVKSNFFKGKFFKEGLGECNERLMDWTNSICNKRTHGTTKEVPLEKFNAEEVNVLHPLPVDDYEISEWGKRKVNTDAHINVKNNYYSVPYEYIGKEVIVEAKDKLILIYGDNQLLTTHTRCFDKGKFITNNSHYPSYKVMTESEYYQHYKEKMELIGENAYLYYKEVLKRNGYGCYRAIRGIIILTKTYGNSAVDKACKRALFYDAYGYRIIKTICQKQLYEIEPEVLNDPVKYGTTFERPLTEYTELLTDGDYYSGSVGEN